MNLSDKLPRRLLSNASVALAGDLLSRALSLLLTIWITRTLGPTSYGQYTAVLASLSLIASAIGFGLDTWLLREGGRTPEKLLDHVGSVLLTKCLAVIGVVFILGIASNRLPISLAFMVGCLGVIGDGFLNTAFAAMRTRGRNAWVALTQLLLPALMLVILLILQFTTIRIQPLTLITAQSAISWLVVSSVFILGWRRLHGHRPTLSLRAVALGAWAFVVADVVANAYGQSATLFLSGSAGAGVVGIFKPALNVLLMTYIAPSIVFGVSLPMLSAPTLAQQDYRRVIRLWGLGSVIYGLGVGLVLWFGAPLIIRTLYGTDYATSATVLRTFSLVPLLKVGSFTCVLILLSRGRQNWRIVLQATAAIPMIIASAWLIPLYGLSGATWLTVATEVALLSLYAIGAWVTWRQIKPLRANS